MSVQALALIDYSSAALLYTYKLPDAPEHELDLQMVTKKSRGFRAKLGRRIKVGTEDGTWVVSKGAKGILYAVYVLNNCPEKEAYDLI